MCVCVLERESESWCDFLQPESHCENRCAHAKEYNRRAREVLYLQKSVSARWRQNYEQKHALVFGVRNVF